MSGTKDALFAAGWRRPGGKYGTLLVPPEGPREAVLPAGLDLAPRGATLAELASLGVRDAVACFAGWETRRNPRQGAWGRAARLTVPRVRYVVPSSAMASLRARWG